MARRDSRILKKQASQALDKGKHKKALRLYLAATERQHQDAFDEAIR